MTFKDILYWSRTMTYKHLNRYYIRTINHGYFKASQSLNSMCLLNSFRRANSHSKIRMWKYAIKAYKKYKTP